MNNRIVKNASWIILCRIMQAVLNLVVSMITARYLGPSDYGLITYASSIVAFVVPLVRLGLNGILVQEFIEEPENDGMIIGTSTTLTVLSSLAGILGIWFFTSIANPDEPTTVVVCVIYSISLIFQMTEMIQYWYQAKLLSRYVSVVSLLSRIAVSLYRVFIVVSGKSIYWFSIVNSLDFVIISAALYKIYHKFGGQRLAFSLEMAKRMLSKSKHFIIAGVMVSVFGQTDKIMLKLMISDAESGQYSVALTCAGMSVFLFTAIIDSLRPEIYENKKNDELQYRKNNIRLYSIIIYMALFQSVVLTLLAEPIISILYGAEYLAAADVLRIVTWYSAFSYLGSARHIWFLAENKQKYIWITNSVGAITNIVGNSLLIPRFGASGAAVASVGTQILTNFILSFIKPIRENGMWILAAFSPRVLYELLIDIKRQEKKKCHYSRIKH